MDRQQDSSGDYGYDLAHEAPGRRGKPEEPPGAAEQQQVPAGRRSEPDGDFGYDEAHDF